MTCVARLSDASRGLHKIRARSHGNCEVNRFSLVADTFTNTPPGNHENCLLEGRLGPFTMLREQPHTKTRKNTDVTILLGRRRSTFWRRSPRHHQSEVDAAFDRLRIKYVVQCPVCSRTIIEFISNEFTSSLQRLASIVSGKRQQLLGMIDARLHLSPLDQAIVV
jgi:hypothetical protein